MLPTVTQVFDQKNPWFWFKRKQIYSYGSPDKAYSESNPPINRRTVRVKNSVARGNTLRIQNSPVLEMEFPNFYRCECFKMETRQSIGNQKGHTVRALICLAILSCAIS